MGVEMSMNTGDALQEQLALLLQDVCSSLALPKGAHEWPGPKTEGQFMHGDIMEKRCRPWQQLH